LKVAKAADGGVDVTLRIRNTGAMPSDEVPQVYLSAPSNPPAGVQFPVRKLVAFDRVHVGAGQAKTVTLHVPERQLQYWSSKDQNWIKPSGKRIVSVGGSSRSLPLRQETD
jgi:beta-glucosidase